MSFEAGTVSFRMFYGPAQDPGDLLERLEARKAGGLEGVTGTASCGWVTGRHLLDTHFLPETARYAGYLRVALRQAQRQVPAELLKAECRMEELAQMAATGQTFIQRKKRMEIRQAVLERLLPQQIPTLRSIPLVHQDGLGIWYAGLTGDAQADALLINAQLLGIPLSPFSLETVAMAMGCGDVRDLHSLRIGEMPAIEPDPAGDFLTWLWFESETRRGVLDMAHHRLAILIEGPLLMRADGTVKEVALKSGTPTNSLEAGTALATGKRLVRARLSLGVGEDVWSCAFNAETFTFSGLKLPEQGALDPISLFQGRMVAIDRFREFMAAIVVHYFKVRRAEDWPETQARMRNWVAERERRP